jgi:formylglycine-generating enzyme required for sulfatase activity
MDFPENSILSTGWQTGFELQMLQAREFACILLFAAALVQPAILCAQEKPAKAPTREINRIGDQPVAKEAELDLTVPAPDPATIKPVETPEQKAARLAEQREQQLQDNLAAARQALEEGRIDQPEQDSAWTWYREALDLDPQNAEALAGLDEVQKRMIDKAGEFARELDFEMADRVLDDAALVRDDQRRIDRAKADIRAFREEYAAEMEISAVTAMDAGDFDQAEHALIDLIALGGMDTVVNQLRRRMEEAKVYGGLKPGQVIRDHFINEPFWSPESVIVQAGSFHMGSDAFEEGRRDNEGPRHRVTFRRGFAMGQTEVTVRQFRAFVEKTRFLTDAEKLGYSNVYDHYSGRLARRDDVTWKMDYEGRKAADDLPVVHVSWNDAVAYTRWLARGTGKPYRLPTEAEFEYVLRAGKTSLYWWGDGTPPEVVENLTGEGDTSRGRRKWETFFENYHDRHWGPAPVRSFPANPFGLHDIGGNVGEWVMDCWHDNYTRAPVDGSAWVNPGCNQRVVRGGYWASSPVQARSAYRMKASPAARGARIGFRIVRDL